MSLIQSYARNTELINYHRTNTGCNKNQYRIASQTNSRIQDIAIKRPSYRNNNINNQRLGVSDQCITLSKIHNNNKWQGEYSFANVTCKNNIPLLMVSINLSSSSISSSANPSKPSRENPKSVGLAASVGKDLLYLIDVHIFRSAMRQLLVWFVQ